MTTPSPRRVWAIPALAACGLTHHNPLPYLADRRHGDFDRLDLGLRSTTALAHPDFASHVPQHHADRYLKQPEHATPLVALVNEGLVVRVDEEARAVRTHARPQWITLTRR